MAVTGMSPVTVQTSSSMFYGYSSVAHIWDKAIYAKGARLPAMSPAQLRHAKERGYAQDHAILVVGKPFTHLTVSYARGAAAPAGLSDKVTRRLVAGRYLI